MCLLWKHNYQEEDCGFLLIDALNAFNEDNSMETLQSVRYKCPNGAQFTLNCCTHWNTLVLSNAGGSGHCLYIKYRVTDGYPLSIIDDYMWILPLIHELRDAHLQVTQP